MMACELEFTLQGRKLDFTMQGVFGGGTICPDGTVIMDNTDGLQIYSKDVASGGTATQTLADQPYTDSDGSSLEQSYDPSTPIVCTPQTPVSDLTCQELNNGLTNNQRSVIQRVPVCRTGVTTSYYANDDGDLRLGIPLVDYETLSCNNPNGNTDRFELYSSNLVTDWSTGLVWTRTLQGSFASWEDTMDDAASYSVDGVSGFHVPNLKELLSLLEMVEMPLGFSPFNFDQGVLSYILATSNSGFRLPLTEFVSVTIVRTPINGGIDVEFRETKASANFGLYCKYLNTI